MISFIPGPEHPAYMLLGMVCGYDSQYRDKKLMLMLQGFADESGGDNFLVLAGYALPFEKWVSFSDEWADVLKDKRLPISYFHMVDAERGEKEFEGIAQEFRKMKIRDLLTVIEKHEPIGISTHVRIKDWEELAMPFARIGFENPYYPLFSTIVFMLAGNNLAYGTETPITFVFDEKAEIKPFAVLAYDIIKRRCEILPQVHRLLGGTPTFADDKKVRPLQAADMLAWHIRRRLEYPDEIRDDISERLEQTISFERELTRDYLKDIVKEY